MLAELLCALKASGISPQRAPDCHFALVANCLRAIAERHRAIGDWSDMSFHCTVLPWNRGNYSSYPLTAPDLPRGFEVELRLFAGDIEYPLGMDFDLKTLSLEWIYPFAGDVQALNSPLFDVDWNEGADFAAFFAIIESTSLYHTMQNLVPLLFEAEQYDQR